MRKDNGWSRWIVGLLLVLLAPAAVAQNDAGDLFGTVLGPGDTPLPGATVTVSGPGAPQVQVTDAQGEFRVLKVSPGAYDVKVELDGFVTAVYRSVRVTVGRTSSIEVRLVAPSSTDDVARIEDVVEVNGSPPLDERKIFIGTAFSKIELEKMPSARDPWAVLQAAPAVLSDRINVGGSESGQQATFISPGTDVGNSVWALDGVVITDMSATGGSPSYYNFEAFDEMQIATGGSDVALATAGVTINMVTRRGTDQWRFSGRYLRADDGLQSSLGLASGELGAAGPWNGGNAQAAFAQGNRIVAVEDYGVEGGGPVVPHKVWAWGSYGVQDIGLLAIGDVPDSTKLESWAGKLNAQPTDGNSLVGFYHFGDKIKRGRDAGPQRPAPTTWDQSGPTSIFKLEDSQMVASQLFFTAMLSYVDSGFQLVPQAGGVGDPSFPNVVRGRDRIWRNSFIQITTDRPQKQARTEASYFVAGAKLNHELRFGAGWRQVESQSSSVWPGQQIVGRADFPLAPDTYIGLSFTEGNAAETLDYWSAFLQDTVTVGRLTANLGLRYDRQTGRNEAATIRPAPIDAGGVLAGGHFAGADTAFRWEDINPRLGLTYALGGERQTLLRLSYSQFADQLGTVTVANDNPTAAQVGYFYWYDNGDLQLTDDEVGGFFAFAGVDPADPGFKTVNITDPRLEAPLTRELVASAEHAVTPTLTLALAGTLRRYEGLLENERLIVSTEGPPGSLGRPHRADDYQLTDRLVGTLPDGTAFDVPVYSLKPGLTTNGGVFLTNGDREQDYVGLSLSLHKQLTNRWMARGHVTWNRWNWRVPASENEDPNDLLPGGNRDGGAVLVGGATTSGPKGDVFINSLWSYSLSALYQLAPDRPWGLNLAANLNGRQGYPVPYNVAFNPGDDIGIRNVLVVGDVEDVRVPDVHQLNLRVEKELKVGEVGLTLSFDAFNVTNESLVIQRESSIAATRINLATGAQSSVGSTSGDFVREIVSPRIFRLGARLSFR